jgi:hypothetical protein
MKKQKDKKEVKSVPFTALDKKEMSALNKLPRNGSWCKP